MRLTLLMNYRILYMNNGNVRVLLGITTWVCRTQGVARN